MKKSIEPIHDTEDVDVSKYSINSTAKMPKLATLLKQKKTQRINESWEFKRKNK